MAASWQLLLLVEVLSLTVQQIIVEARSQSEARVQCIASCLKTFKDQVSQFGAIGLLAIVARNMCAEPPLIGIVLSC